jgi:polyisoprenoid-binding protein YceI
MLTALRPTAALLCVALAAPAVDAADGYTIDPVHSTALFRVGHLGVGHVWGRFDSVTGTLAFNPDDASKDAVTIQIAADSVDTNAAARDKHIKSPDFLDAQQFPTLGFVSSAFSGSTAAGYDVTGALTLHGVTKTITTHVDYIGTGKGMKGEQRIGFETSFTIKRSDFGISGLPGAVGDEVRITLAVEGVAP